MKETEYFENKEYFERIVVLFIQYLKEMESVYAYGIKRGDIFYAD